MNKNYLSPFWAMIVVLIIASIVCAQENEESQVVGLLTQRVVKVISISKKNIEFGYDPVPNEDKDSMEINDKTIVCAETQSLVLFRKTEPIPLHEIKKSDTVRLLELMSGSGIELLAIEKIDPKSNSSEKFSHFPCESMLQSKYKIINK